MAKQPKKQPVCLRPEMVPDVLCGAVCNLALPQDPEAKRLYEKVKADLTLKVSQKLFNPLEHIDALWTKGVARLAEHDYSKRWPAGIQTVVMRELWKDSQRVSRLYGAGFLVWCAFLHKFGQTEFLSPSDKHRYLR